MRSKFISRLNSFVDSQSGATAIEYAMIASLISIVIIGALLLINGSMIDMYNYIQTSVQGAVDSANNG